MCLSDVYYLDEEDRGPVAKNVASVSMRDGKLVFTDIMGITRELSGEIDSIDLLENVIYLRAH